MLPSSSSSAQGSAAQQQRLETHSAFRSSTPHQTTKSPQDSAARQYYPKDFGGFVSIPVVVDLDSDQQFGEGDAKEPGLAAIAAQLPATTFWAFAREFFSKVPELFFERAGRSLY